MPKNCLRVLVCCAALFTAINSSASAAFDCSTPLPAPRLLFNNGGVLKSVIVDGAGRLYFTNTSAGTLLRISTPGATPQTVATGITNGGGLAFDSTGRYLYVGRGNGFAGGLIGNISPAAEIVKFDTLTGAVTPFAHGLRMANGVARAADGTMYASTDVGFGIDKISSAGVVQNDWRTVISGNGMVIDPGQHWLYVNQTFVPAAIQRIPLDYPGPPQTYLQLGLLDIASGLDGLTMDPAGRLVAAANGGLAILRVNANRTYCAVGRNLLLPSAVAYGHGSTGFSAGHLYAVTFSGGVYEIPGGYVAP